MNWSGRRCARFVRIKNCRGRRAGVPRGLQPGLRRGAARRGGIMSAAVLKASGDDSEALRARCASGSARRSCGGARGSRPSRSRATSSVPECAGPSRSAEQTTRDDTGGGRHFQRALVPAGPAPGGERAGLGGSSRRTSARGRVRAASPAGGLPAARRATPSGRRRPRTAREAHGDFGGDVFASNTSRAR